MSSSLLIWQDTVPLPTPPLRFFSSHLVGRQHKLGSCYSQKIELRGREGRGGKKHKRVEKLFYHDKKDWSSRSFPFPRSISLSEHSDAVENKLVVNADFCLPSLTALRFFFFFFPPLLLGLNVKEMSLSLYESNENAIPFLAPACLVIGTITDDPSGPPQPVPARGPRQLQEEPLDVILSPELDKMVTDGEDL